MFSLDDEDTSQSEIASFELSCFEMSRNQYSINCESDEKISKNKSEIYRRLEFNKNVFPADPNDTSATAASTSRFDNLILNGSVSVPTSSFMISDQYINDEIETVKIVNNPVCQEEMGNELIGEFETIDLAAASTVIATENRCENWPSVRSVVSDSYRFVIYKVSL
jgi:hypothetical protein